MSVRFEQELLKCALLMDTNFVCCLAADLMFSIYYFKVKVLCHLHHDQLRAVFHVSQRIRKAVSLCLYLLEMQHSFWRLNDPF